MCIKCSDKLWLLKSHSLLLLFLEMCCARIIQSNVLSLILRIFDRWERYEGKTKLKICHYSVVTLQRVCYLSKFSSSYLTVLLMQEKVLNMAYKFVLMKLIT